MVEIFTVATGNVDSEGDIIVLSGIKVPQKKILVFHNFDQSSPIGEIEGYEIKGNEFIVKATLAEDVKGLYPAIGYTVNKSRQEGDVRVIEDLTLHSIGLCGNPNADETIKPIS